MSEIITRGPREGVTPTLTLDVLADGTVSFVVSDAVIPRDDEWIRAEMQRLRDAQR